MNLIDKKYLLLEYDKKIFGAGIAFVFTHQFGEKLWALQLQFLFFSASIGKLYATKGKR